MRLLALVLALCSSACVDLAGAGVGRYVEREEKRFTVTGRPELAVSTFDGTIEVRPWDRAEVEVIVEKHAANKDSAAEITIDAEQRGNRVTVDVRAPKLSGFSFHSGRSAKLIVSVPAESDLTARSGDGSIDVERIAGAVDLHSGDGRINAHELHGGAVRATTGDGSIHLSGTFGALTVHTGDGNVVVSAANVGRAAGDWDISTGDGSVTLEVPKGFGAELDVHTGDGRIHLDDVTVSNVTGALRDRTMTGRLGEGGASLRVRTGDGSITLRSVRPSGSADNR
jgi:DUF4097 and DUF4098 domain-containing protein YvlB